MNTMQSLRYSRVLKILGVLSLLAIFSACTPRLEPPLSKCDRVRPEPIYQVEPLRSTVRQVAFFDISAAWSFPPGDGLSYVKLFLDGEDLTERASLSLSKDSPPTLGLILYQVTEPLAQGRHTARVTLESRLGKQYCYGWDFEITLPEEPYIDVTPSHGRVTHNVFTVDAKVTNTLDEAITAKAIVALGCAVEHIEPAPPFVLVARESQTVRVSLECPKKGMSWMLQGIIGFAPFPTIPYCSRRPAIINKVDPPENTFVMQAASFHIGTLWGSRFEPGDGLVVRDPWTLPVRLLLDGEDVTEKTRISLCDNFPSSCGGISYKVTKPLALGRHTVRLMLKSYQGKQYCYEWDFSVALPRDF